MVTVIRAINIVLLLLIFTFGGCVGCLWHNYQETAYDPCEEVGQNLGLTRIQTHAHRMSNGPAYCAGFDHHSRWVRFEAW